MGKKKKDKVAAKADGSTTSMSQPEEEAHKFPGFLVMDTAQEERLRARSVFVFACLKGRKVRVHTEDGVWEGILHTVDIVGIGVELRMAKKILTTSISPLQVRRLPLVHSVTILGSSVLYIECADCPTPQCAKDTAKTAGFTDSEIVSREGFKEVQEKTLVPWTPEEGLGEDAGLRDHAYKEGTWDQFGANRRFGLEESSYSDEQYTVGLPARSDPKYAELEKSAEEKLKRFNIVPNARRRGSLGDDGDNRTEEERYSAVTRQAQPQQQQVGGTTRVPTLRTPHTAVPGAYVPPHLRSYSEAVRSYSEAASQPPVVLRRKPAVEENGAVQVQHHTVKNDEPILSEMPPMPPSNVLPYERRSPARASPRSLNMNNMINLEGSPTSVRSPRNSPRSYGLSNTSSALSSPRTYREDVHEHKDDKTKPEVTHVPPPPPPPAAEAEAEAAEAPATEPQPEVPVEETKTEEPTSLNPEAKEWVPTSSAAVPVGPVGPAVVTAPYPYMAMPMQPFSGYMPYPQGYPVMPYMPMPQYAGQPMPPPPYVMQPPYGQPNYAQRQF